MEGIVLENVTKKYCNKQVLKAVNFVFEQGKCYVLRGESGCGKTTLLNLLANYITADTGTIYSAGKIAYLFQDELLFSNLTVAENLRLRLYAEDISTVNEETLILSGLEKLKIPSLMEQRVSVLSGGERQRVELAGILLGNPNVILLDEPIAKLDGGNKQNTMDVIHAAFKGKTLIAVTHERESFPDDFISLRLKEGNLFYE